MNRRPIIIVATVLIALLCIGTVGAGVVVMGLGGISNPFLRSTDAPISIPSGDGDTEYLNCVKPVVSESLEIHGEIADARGERDPEERFLLMCEAQPEWQEGAEQNQQRHLGCPHPHHQYLQRVRDFIGSASSELVYDTDAIRKYCRGEDWHDPYWLEVSREHAERFNKYMEWGLAEAETYYREQ